MRKIILKDRVAACGLAGVLLLVLLAAGLTFANTWAGEDYLQLIQLSDPAKIDPTDPRDYYKPGEQVRIGIAFGYSYGSVTGTMENPMLVLTFNTDEILGADDSPNPLAKPVFPLNTNKEPVLPVLHIAHSTDDSDIGEIEEYDVEGVLSADGTQIGFQLRNIGGGDYFSGELIFTMPKLYTPNGFPLLLTATLDSQDPSQHFEYTLGPIIWRCDLLSIKKYMADNDYMVRLTQKGDQIETYQVLAGVQKPGTPAAYIDPDKTAPVKFSFEAMGLNSSYRLYNKSVTIDYLPSYVTNDGRTLYAEFYASDNPGFTWQVLTIGGRPAVRCEAAAGNEPTTLVLRFPEAPEGTVCTNEVEREYYIVNPQFDDNVFDKTDPAFCNVVIFGATVDQKDMDGMLNKTAVMPRNGGLDSPGNYKSVYRAAVSQQQIIGDYWWVNEVINNLADKPTCTDVVIRDSEMDPEMRITKFIVAGPMNGVKLTVKYHVEGEPDWRIYGDFDPSDASKLRFDSLQAAAMVNNKEDPYFPLNYSTNATLMPNPNVSKAYAVVDLSEAVESGDVIDGIEVSTKTLKPGEQMILAVCSQLRKDREKIDLSSGKSYENRSVMICNLGMTDPNSPNSKAIHRLQPYGPMMVANHDRLLDNHSYGDRTPDNPANNTITIHTSLHTVNVDPDDPVDGSGAQYIVYLPEGVTYNKNSVRSSGGFDLDLLDNYGEYGEPRNPDGEVYAGKPNALIWTLKNNTTFLGGGYLFDFIFDVTVTDNCWPGINTFEMYYTWKESDRIVATLNPALSVTPFDLYPNDLDLRDDGNTSTTFLYDDPIFTYALPQSSGARKYVKGDLNQGQWKYPTSSPLIEAPGQGSPGSEADFRIRYNNGTGSSAVDDLMIIDILPYIGDRFIDDPNTQRLSEFDVKLRGPVKVEPTLTSNFAQKDFDYFYTTEDPLTLTNINTYANDPAIWTSQADFENLVNAGDEAWGNVTAFKVVLTSGHDNADNVGKIASGEIVTIDIPVILPGGEDKVGKVAYNSFAYKTTTVDGKGTINFLEVPKVGIKILEYNVGVAKIADKSAFAVGETVTYTITVTNTKGTAVTGAYFVDILDKELQFLDCVGPGTWSAPETLTDGRTKLRVTIGNMAPHEVLVFTVTATVLVVKSNIVNWVRVDIDQLETTYDDNEAKAVIGAAALHIRQLIMHPGSPVPDPLPDAYVHVLGADRVTSVGNFNEWAKFPSWDYDTDYIRQDNYPCNMITIPFDTDYQVIPLIPGGYELVRIEYTYDVSVAPTAGDTVSICEDGGTAHAEAWVTIILKPKPDTPPDTIIVNKFPQLP